MQIKGSIIDKFVILGNNGKKYKYTHLDLTDTNIAIGDQVRFVPGRNWATHISKLSKEDIMLETQSKEVFAPKKNHFEFGFTDINTKRLTDSIESKIYTKFVRQHGTISCILPLLFVPALLFFKEQIAEILLSVGELRNFINPNSIEIYLNIAIALIFVFAYLIPLNNAFAYLSVASHDQYTSRQIKNFNLFFIICIVLTILKLNNLFGLDVYALYINIAVAVFGLLAYFYKLKAFVYLIQRTDTKLFALALLVDFVLMFVLNITNKIFDIFKFEFGSMAWRYIAAFAIMAPFYLIAFFSIKRIK